MAGRADGNAAAIFKLPRTMFKEHVLQSEGVCLENSTFSTLFQSGLSGFRSSSTKIP